MKKRVLSFILVLCMVLTLLPVGVFAASVVNSGYCGDNLTWTLDREGVLTISGMGAMGDYSVSSPWYSNRYSIESVVIEDGVTSIGNGAFDGCSYIKSVTIPDSVTSIGYEAFYKCYDLTSVTIPESVTSIGFLAFSDCYSLTEINYNAKAVANLQSDSNIFYDAGGLGGGLKVTFGDTVEKIPAYLFYIYTDTANTSQHSPEITSVTIGESVTSIGNYAFCGCSSLTSVTMSDSVKSIGKFAFSECSSLESLTIPDSVTGIETGTFSNCASMTDVTIGSGVTRIGNYAFYECGSLKNAVIPDSVVSIGEYAFAGCYDLESVTIGNGVTSIGDCVFSGCRSLTSMTIGSSVTSIGGGAFGNSSLSSVTFEGCPNSISKDAFIDVTAAAFYYIEDNWPETMLVNYGGSLTWMPLSRNAHNYAAVVTAPTCTEKGYTTYTCSHCGDSYKTDYVASLGHNFINGVCKRCGADDPNYVPPVQENPFIDVKDNAWYRDAVLWAYNHKPEPVTKGTDATHFSPDGVCSRGQVVAFLWRLAGSPEPSTLKSPFVDVVNSGECAYYYKAILWAYENGVTKGVDETHFAPLAAMTRGQLVTFLWRASGSPDTSAYKNSFADVTNSGVCQYYYDGILWAAANGITTGTGGNLFEPNLTVTRCQVVTFLSRYEA